MARLGQLGVAVALAASGAYGYHHFTHYSSRLGPYTPVYEKFDLNALVNKTVYFYVSDERPALAPTDSYEAVVAQVRQALAAWNGVPTSDLRVDYGGVANLAALQAQTPGGEIVFEELPPGVLGLGGPMTRLPQTGNFIPIVRSRLILPKDLTNPSRTSASESFLNSLVHEIGHALGLQHSMTSSVMSVEVIRSTTRARPLASDDVAGISLLYPTPEFTASTGAIAGLITAPNGRGLPLISVVAVNPSGGAISALTAPDGTYRIEGIPPGTYLVYAHALPPATQAGLGPANIVLPVDNTGVAFEASGPMETRFYGGVTDPGASIPVVVSAGGTNEGIDIRLAERSSLTLYDVTTYSFPGNGAPAVLPAFLNTARGSGFFLAFGQGLSANIRNTTVSILGGGVTVRPGSPAPYAQDARFAQIDLEFGPFAGAGPRHLVFRMNGDIYVRPGGVHLVTQGPPAVRDVQVEGQNGSTVLVLAGDNLNPNSRVFLDGAPAAVRGFDDATGRLRVAPPPGPGGRQAVITVYNQDGQSSMFLQSAAPATYTYPPSETPSITVSPAAGAAGRDVTIEIQGTNTQFVDGETVVGFGTPDIVTRRVWVLSPTRLLAVASISPRASVSATTVSVTTGLAMVVLPAGFQVNPAPSGSNIPVVSFGGLTNSATGQPAVAPGTLATLFGTNLTLGPGGSAAGPLPTTLAGTTVTMNDQPVPLLLVSPNQINLQIPFTLTPGPVILRVNNGTAVSAPMVIPVDAAAPGLFRVLNAAGATVDGATPARIGETLVVLATGLGSVIPPATAGQLAGSATVTGLVRVSIGGVNLVPSFAGLAPGTAGVYQVSVPLTGGVPTGDSLPLQVSVDGRASNTLTIAIR